MQQSRRIRKRLCYPNVIATLALFLSLGGGSALALSGQNTVQSDDIVNGQVTNQDLAANSVKTSKVKDGSLGLNDVHTLVARVRGGKIKTSDIAPTIGDPYPLKGASWTQGTKEIDQLMGEATFKAPHVCDGGSFVGASISLSLNGAPFGSASIGGSTLGPGPTPDSTVTVPVFLANSTLFEPSSLKHRVITAKVSDSCMGANQNWTVKRLALDVRAAR